jgi:hypothetical protein
MFIRAKFIVLAGYHGQLDLNVTRRIDNVTKSFMPLPRIHLDGEKIWLADKRGGYKEALCSADKANPRTIFPRKSCIYSTFIRWF